MLRVFKMAFAVGLAMAPLPAAATAMMDQKDVTWVSSAETAFTNADRQLAQSFTAGITGLLTRIEVPLFFHDNFANAFSGVNVYATDGTLPTTLLGTGTFQSIAAGAVNFELALQVVAGQVYAFEPLRQSGSAWWKADVLHTYTRGTALVNVENSWISAPDVDLNFVTYVDADRSAPIAGGVPEPTTWAMTIAGFGLAGAALRRRRRMAGDAVAATA